MRRAVLIITALAIAAVLILSIYLYFTNRTIELTIDDLLSADRSLDGNGRFEGKFKSEEGFPPICDYTYWVEDKALYITVYYTYGNVEPLPTNEDGYATIAFDTEPDIEKIYYCADGRTSTLTCEFK